MRVVVQRVKSASVSLVAENGNTEIISQIGPGLVGLVGIHVDDTIDDVKFCCQRLINCKLWSNDNHKPWKYSVKQKQYECLLVSQFTLYGTLSKKSYQPDYKLAMKSESAKRLYEDFLQTMRTVYDSDPNKIHDGQFGAMMDVALINDGPVTIIIESRTSSDTGNVSSLNDDNDIPI
jgi:D-aminoacyl-tRNA deacylase